MGRPLGIQGSEIKVSLPKIPVSLFINPANGKSDEVNSKEASSILYLSSLIKLANAALSSYRKIYNAPASANEDSRLQLLHSSFECLQEWKNSMPEEMKAENCRDDAPFWLHRQCACLILCKLATRFRLI
jgi:hypothetical protein